MNTAAGAISSISNHKVLSEPMRSTRRSMKYGGYPNTTKAVAHENELMRNNSCATPNAAITTATVCTRLKRSEYATRPTSTMASGNKKDTMQPSRAMPCSEPQTKNNKNNDQ